ncbi:PP2C family protein-serine/threonine phosphatase [Streptomyces roseifaciens]|uniref:PP2C family protein-serine/threonine phosphatase n=1 Tax=Streptomyces roseifaciens TaxID=1488406 RepID=UPI000717F4BC|nr:PP2C family protein-serine/threonine phosphatase [Streptomyces roseifaciens]
MPLPRSVPGFGRWWHTGRSLVAVPLGLIALVMFVDLLTPPDIHLGPLLVAAPAISAAIGGPVLTAVIGALAVTAQVVIGIFHGGLETPNHQAQIAALLLISVFLVLFRRAREQREQELSQARWVAEVAQRVLLRPVPTRLGPLRIASMYVAAEAEARIGGDLYAAARTVHGTRVMIGDVRGKGLPTIGDAASLLGAFRAAAHRNPPLPRLVAHLQNATYWDMAEPADDRTTGEGFITAAVLDIPDDQPVLRLINCGHPPPLVLSDGKVTTLTVADPALPLGLAGGLTEDDYESESFPYRAGDVLLLYTDGVIETRDAGGGFYPLADRVAAWQETDPDRLVQRLHRDLLAYAGGAMADDVAVMALERLPREDPQDSA